MSVSPRPLNRVYQALLSQFMHQCREMGPDGAMLLHEAELTVDPNHRTQGIVAEIYWKGRLLWRAEMPLTAESIENIETPKLRENMTAVMRNSLDIAAQMWRVRLEKQFPNSIKDVRLEYREDIREKQLIVDFKNGHKASVPESEGKDNEFLARCAMLYDLPELRR